MAKGIEARAIKLLREGKAIIFPIAEFMNFKKQMERTFSFSSTAMMMFLVGKYCGISEYQRVKKAHDLRNAEEALKRVVQIKGDAGWGDIDFSGVDFKAKIGSVKVNNCFEGREYGESGKPVCHFMRGYLSGLLTEALDTDIILLETSCVTLNREHCDFEIR